MQSTLLHVGIIVIIVNKRESVCVSHSQPPRWPPMKANSSYSHPCVVPPTTYQDWSVSPIEYGSSERTSPPMLCYKRFVYNKVLPCSVFDHLLWRKPAAMS